jgi:hypothetical protein
MTYEMIPLDIKDPIFSNVDSLITFTFKPYEIYMYSYPILELEQFISNNYYSILTKLILSDYFYTYNISSL